MRILFLDFDGVLNSVSWMERCPEDWRGMNAIDPEALRRLERILEATGALVVVSSVWRKRHDIPKIQSILRKKGMPKEMTHRIIGATCDLQETRCRGREIDIWLKLTGCVTDFVVLDDSSDTEPHLDRLVRIDGQVGLQDADVDKALKLFQVVLP